jgi:hypothetical protein
MDFTAAFLNSILLDTIYMRYPDGVTSSISCLKLEKVLYGLKQSNREWYLAIRKKNRITWLVRMYTRHLPILQNHQR